MTSASITELRLTAFKSFRDAMLPLGDVTFLTGRNSSGKSNALDGLDVLSRIAGGEDLADALDGRRQAGTVRGGSRGCAPHGSNAFSLGCTVTLGSDEWHYSVKVQVSPDLRILAEQLEGPAVAAKSGTRRSRETLFHTRPPVDGAPGIEAEIYSGKRGANPTRSFRDNRCVLT